MRDREYIGRGMMRLKLPGRRSGGRPRRRFMDEEEEDVTSVGVGEEDGEDGDRCSPLSIL